MPEDRISQIRERYRETQKAGTPDIKTPDIKTPDIKTPVTQDTNRISLIRERYQQMGMDSRPDNDQGSRPDNDQGWITNLSTGVEAGYDQMRGGLKYFGGEVVDWFDGEQPGTGDRWKKEAASILENAPQGDSFWYDFGSFLPQTVGSLAAVLATPFTGGTSLAAIPAIIGTANIATIAGMSVGSSLHEYDQYTEEMGLETSEMVRLGTGLLNGAIEYAAEKIRLGRFLPKGGLVKKMTAKMVAKNPSLSKNILHKFAQQSPTGYRKYIKAGAYMLNQGKEEGLEELFTETAQSFVNMAYKGEDAWDDFGERAWKSFRGGAMMGIGIGTAGVWATNKTNTTRRKKHGVTLAEYVREKESMMDFVKAPDGSRPLESGVVEIAGTTKNGNYIGITPKGKQIELLPDQISKSITMSNDDFEAYNNALGENHAKAKEILDDVYVKDMTARIDGTVNEMEYFGGQDNAGNGKYFAASDEKGQAIGFVISGGLDTQTDGLSYLIVSDGQGGVKKDQIKSSKIHTIEEISRESIVNYLMTNAGIEKQNMDAQQKAQEAVEDEEVLTNDRVKTKHGNGVVTKMSEVGAVVQLDNGEEKIIPVEELEILRDGIDAEEESVIMKQGRPTDKGVEATSDRKINNEPSQTVQISAKKSVNIYPNEDGTQTIGEGYKDIDEAKAVVNALKKARPNLDKNGFEIINLNQGGDEWAAPEYVIRYSPKTLKDVQVKPTSELEDNRKTGSKESAIGDTRADDGKAGGEDVKTGELKTEVTPGDGVSAIQTGSEKPATGGESNRAGEEIKSNSREQIKGKVENPLTETGEVTEPTPIKEVTPTEDKKGGQPKESDQLPEAGKKVDETELINEKLGKRNIWIPNMTKSKLDKLLNKESLTENDIEDLKDFEYFLLTDKESATEKGFYEKLAVSQQGEAYALKDKFLLTNIRNKINQGKKVKQPWEMNYDEFYSKIKFYKSGGVDSYKLPNGTKGMGSRDKTDWFKSRHKKVIEQALSEGKIIPENVKKDYPELFEGKIDFMEMDDDTLTEYIKSKENEYGGKNKWLISDEYKGIYPALKKRYDSKTEELQKLAAKKLDESGLKIGDNVQYAVTSGLGLGQVITGTLVNRKGFPYVKTKVPVNGGKKSVMWNKGWVKTTVKESLPVETPVSEDKKVVAPIKPQGVKDTPKPQEKQRPAGEVLSELTDKKTPEVSGKDNKISTESAAKVDTPELSKKAQKMLNELQQGKPFNEVSEENELTEKEQIQLAKLFAESDKFPSKQYAKKDKIDIGFESQSNHDVKPIEKKITPIKDNSTASKISSLKSIVAGDDRLPILKGVFKDAENNKLVASDTHVLIVIEDKTIKKSEVINPKTGEFIADGADYPNYDAVIPRDNPLKRTVNVNEWLAQLNGLVNTKRFFSNPLRVRIIIGDNTYHFNSEIMQSVFQVFAEHGVENVELQFSDPTRALVVESNKGIMGLVMPFMEDDDSKASGLYGYKTMAEWEYMSKTTKGVEVPTEKKVGEKAVKTFVGVDDSRAYINEANKVFDDVRNKRLEAISEKLQNGKLTNKEYVAAAKEMDKQFASEYPQYFKYDTSLKNSESLDNAKKTLLEKGSAELLSGIENEFRKMLGLETTEGGVSTLEEKKITQVTGIKPKNIRDVYKAGREIFGLNRSQALAQAIVVNTVVNKIAKNRGVTAEKVWGEIEFRKGSVQGKDVLYQQAKAAMFYSPTEKALTKIQQNKGTAEQFKAMLLKNGAKQAELDWMGWDEFAKANPTMTKAEIQDWIDGNKVEVEEVTKTDIEDKWESNGDDHYKYGDYYISKDTAGKWIVVYRGKIEGKYESLEGAKNYIEAGTSENTKYSQYQLEGGENYMELLLTIPEKRENVTYSIIDDNVRYGGNYKVKNNVTGEEILGSFKTKEAAEKWIKGQSGSRYSVKDNFKSSHFDEPNILAHIRFNERTDSEGNRVLFLEEIQSDWAQKGKKEGFKIPITENEIDVKYFPREEGQDPKIYPGYWESYDNRTGEMITRHPGRMTEAEARNDAFAGYDAFHQNSVPDMPFKQTPQWVNLAIRRMMRYAAENGFDRIAWTPGSVQAERYDLSKTISSINAEKTNKGDYKLEISINGKGIQTEYVTTEKMPDIIGKELSDKIIKNNGGFYSGLDLKVGGEGMKAFYDAIVPNAAKELGRKFGAKVEETQISVTKTKPTQYADFNEYSQNTVKVRNTEDIKTYSKGGYSFLDASNNIISKQRAYELIERGQVISATRSNDITVQSLPITDSMKESALNEGMPLFQKQGTGKTAKGAIQFLADGNAIISALTNPNVSTPLHEIAHLYERYMPDSERKAVLKWAKHKTWSTETSEMFARGFEKYLATGKAPLPSLDGVFRRFKAWLTDIYNGITGSEIDIQLNDAMTDIYSAMLGADVVQKTTKNKNKVEKPVDDLLFQIAGESGAANLDKAERKQKQLGIVLKKNPISDNIHTGIRTINDIKTAEEVFSESINDNEDATPDFTVDDMKAALESGRITVYSSKPIKNGVFISPSYMQAESYSGNKKVYSKEVSVNDVAWIDQFEGQLTEIDKAEAATTRLDNLGVAKKMESKFLVEQEKRETDAGLKHTWEISNEDALKIRMGTGWEKGSDGEWRYEVPDGEFKNIKYSLSEIMDKETKLSDIWDDKELFNAYPELGNISIKIDNNSGYGGTYVKESNTIELNLLKSVGKEGQKSTLLHEIQHAIQEIEGFARGGNTEMFKGISELKKLFTKQREDFSKEFGFSAWEDNLMFNDTKRFSALIDAGFSDISLKPLYEAFANEKLPESDRNYFVNRMLKFDDDVSSHKDIDPFTGYQRLAGEVEARNVQNRINMSEEDRRGTPLKETEDTPRKDQIIYEGDDVKFMANQTGDPNFDSRHEPIIKGAHENALEIFHDNMRSVKTLQELITKRGGVMGEDLDTHLFENLTSSISKAEIENFENSIQRRFLGAVKHIAGRYGIDADGIGIYLMAKHASERNKVMQMQGFKLEEGSGMSNVEAEAYIREFEGKVDQADIKELLDSRSEVTGFTLRTLNKKGLITNDQYRKYKNQYTDYVPLRGWAGETASDIYKYIEDDINRDAPPMKHAKGRTSLADNPLPYMLSMAHAAIIMGNKNVMRTKALNMVRANSQMQDLFSENPIYEVKQDDGTTITTVNRPDQELFDQKKVTVIKDTRNLYKNTIHNASQHDVIVYDNGEKKVISFTDPVVARSINGENIIAKDFVRKVLSPTVGRVQRFISANFTSKNPAFVPVNWTRDFGYAYFSHFVKGDKGDAEYFRKSMMNSFKAVSRHLRHNLGTTFSEQAINDAQIKISNGERLTNADYDALYYSFKMNGGETGYVHLKNINNFKNDIEKELRLAVGNPTRWEATNNYAPIKKAGEWLEYMAQMSENQARFSTYLVSMSKGKSHAQSASDAKNITVNFNRRGKVSGLMGNLYVFFNANVQGVANIGKLAKDHPKAFAKLGAGFMTMGFLSALLTRMWADDDDDENAFDKIPTYIKYNFWVLPNPAYYLGYGEKKEKFLTIPLPHGFRAVYALGVMAYEASTGTKGAGDIAIDLVTNTADSFSPITSLNPDEMLKGDITLRPIVPSWMMPFYDINVNRDFAGRMVYKEPFTKALEKKIPGSEQSLPNVNPLLKNAARGLNRLGGGDLNRTAAIGFNPKTTKVDAERNEWKWLIYDWNPSKAEHLLEYYLGGKGKFFNNIYKTTRDATLSVINKENQMNEYTTPILRRFIYTPYTKDTPDKYWELKNEISTWKGLYNDAKSNKDNEMIGRFRKNRRMMDLINEFDRSEKRIKDMNERIDRSINPEMKKKLIKDRRMIIKDFLNKSKEIDKRHENSNR